MLYSQPQRDRRLNITHGTTASTSRPPGLSATARSLVAVASLLTAACASGGVVAPPVTTGDVTDDFERATLGGSWSVQSPGAAAITSGDLSSASANLMIATYTAGTFPSDQFSEVVLSSAFSNADLRGVQVFVRRNESTRQRYGFFVDNLTNRYTLKFDGGSPGIVLLDLPGAPLVANDVVRIEVIGDQIRGFVNGIERISVSDDRLTAGQPGLVVNPTAVVPRVVAAWRGGAP